VGFNAHRILTPDPSAHGARVLYRCLAKQLLGGIDSAVVAAA